MKPITLTLIYIDVFLRWVRIMSIFAILAAITKFSQADYKMGLVFISCYLLSFNLHSIWSTIGSVGNTLSWLKQGCPQPTFFEVEQKPNENDNDKGER